MTKPTIQGVSENLHGIHVCLMLIIALAIITVTSCSMMFMSASDDVQEISKAIYNKNYDTAVAQNTIKE